MLHDVGIFSMIFLGRHFSNIIRGGMILPSAEAATWTVVWPVNRTDCWYACLVPRLTITFPRYVSFPENPVSSQLKIALGFDLIPSLSRVSPNSWKYWSICSLVTSARALSRLSGRLSVSSGCFFMKRFNHFLEGPLNSFEFLCLMF